jgi:hypothetical protein
MKIWHIILIVLWAGILTIMGWILFVNAQYRQDHRDLQARYDELEKENMRLVHWSDSLVLSAIGRLKEDSIMTVQVEALKDKLEYLNNKNIVTVYETYSTVTALDLDGDIEFLSRYVGAAAEDTLSR